MKTFSFLGRLIERRKQFRRDCWHLRVSLCLRPKNWHAYRHPDFKFMRLTNEVEDMELWIGNSKWGLHFMVRGQTYGGLTVFGGFVPWRISMYRAAMAAIAKEHIRITS